jgi:hypothetical protein
VLDAPWLARDTAAGSIGGLLGRAAGWRAGTDLAINLEGDIRSEPAAVDGGGEAPRRLRMAGGGPLLTDVAA